VSWFVGGTRCSCGVWSNQVFASLAGPVDRATGCLGSGSVHGVYGFWAGGKAARFEAGRGVLGGSGSHPWLVGGVHLAEYELLTS